MADTAILTTAAVALDAPAGYLLRLRGYKKTVVAGLVDLDGKESLHHFLTYNPDDPVEACLITPCAALHNSTLGLLFPCAAGDVANEHLRGQDAKRFTWMVEFDISADGYANAKRFVDERARRWNYHVRKRNCVTFAHRVATEAGIPMPRPFIQRPMAFAARIRGALRKGRFKAKGGVIPPGRRLGALPESILAPAPPGLAAV